MYQAQYWQELTDLKIHQNYLALHQENAEGWERRIKIFLAIMSSGSIGGWAIWRELAPIWAGLIALSQFISAIYVFVPFKSRIKPLGAAIASLTVLFDQAEHGWFAVAEGQLTDAEVNDARYKIRKAKHKIMADTIGVMLIPADNKMLEKAETQAENYFNNYHLDDRND